MPEDKKRENGGEDRQNASKNPTTVASAKCRAKVEKIKEAAVKRPITIQFARYSFLNWGMICLPKASMNKANANVKRMPIQEKGGIVSTVLGDRITNPPDQALQYNQTAVKDRRPLFLIGHSITPPPWKHIWRCCPVQICRRRPAQNEPWRSPNPHNQIDPYPVRKQENPGLIEKQNLLRIAGRRSLLHSLHPFFSQSGGSPTTSDISPMDFVLRWIAL